MAFLDFLEKNWDWLNAKPWAAATFAVIFLSMGWAGARIFDKIKSFFEARNSSIQNLPSATITYPPAGNYGKNILANSVKDVHVDERVSMRAEIPPGTRLHIELKGPRREGQTGMGAWFITLPYMNWIKRDYHDNDSARQNFDAESGVAELQMWFAWVGEVEISAIEGSSPTPSWSKTIRVHPLV
ncbi:hypothetical protein LK540_13425 [Massilia sp. IC2-278]|uniref:hypothetical protein n=1 Tax=Massilia sp. IC2-278 TaxID=2887200 RepID=UPI001E5A6A59|nr:hypothetical protein [Massilia sp. IC2-278]MCC2961424.1 hypothetical protein [Massilia sp. IC2-278]